MSAQLREERWLEPIGVPALNGVLAIERVAYEFPWTRGNFIDAIAAGYWCQSLRDGSASHCLGYMVAMPGVEEVHLLNLTVVPEQQGRGHARFMLDALVGHCRARQARQLWLEVRVSNARGCELYARYGFREIGVRKGYYPAAAQQRENAIVMSLLIEGAPHALV
jgi:ribosomal-protein-alanine N-acetyltransferase